MYVTQFYFSFDPLRLHATALQACMIYISSPSVPVACFGRRRESSLLVVNFFAGSFFSIFFSGVKLHNFIVSMYIYSFSILCCRCCCDIRFSSPISYMRFVAHCLIIFFVLPFATSISLVHRCAFAAERVDRTGNKE